jgi:sigma-B regulation protein RsbU (phosphoserine phosphatase)
MFLLGDVSGKGVAASLLMTHLHATFRTLASMDLELQTLLGVANKLFCESTSAGQYATLVCGRASTTGEVEIASAGHLPVLLVTGNGVKELNATGIPLGIFSTSTYTVHRTQLQPGDSLFLFTDGVSEAYDPSGSEYGIAGLARSAGERYGWAADELVSGCREDVERYSRGARPTDDQTLLAIHLTESDDVTFQAIDMQTEVEFLAQGV